jgi:hypothetical protein
LWSGDRDVGQDTALVVNHVSISAAGLLVAANRRVTVGGIAVLGIRIGPCWIDAPVRVIEALIYPPPDSPKETCPDTRSGEEVFLIHLDPKAPYERKSAPFPPLTLVQSARRPGDG